MAEGRGLDAPVALSEREAERAPGVGISTVNTSVVTPAACARSSALRIKPRSLST